VLEPGGRLIVCEPLADQNPDLAIAWNRVTVRLSSHDAGGITERDLRLAAQIDAL